MNQICKTLMSSVNMIDKKNYIELIEDYITVCEHMMSSELRIAVFGPFNQGKSTLLNALLGNKSLPIDIVPTTGTAIVIKYGSVLETHITLKDGRHFTEPGAKILQQFAVLAEDRCMRDDVVSVEIFCPHSILKNGVTLIDLPGANDQPEQEAFVKKELLSVDLAIQVLSNRP